jgi:thiol:disulfide interchange protein DsbC
MNLLKKPGVLCCLTTLLLVASLPVFAAPVSVTPETALREAFPKVQFESIAPTDIAGLYEVVTGQNVVYFYPEKEYIFVGDIVNKEGKSLTAEKRGMLAAKLMKNLPLDKAVKIGAGKRVIVEITDPDCPYCRKGSEYLAQKTDLTRYVFFAPLAHPAAISKIQYILGAQDKAKAYEEMMAGKAIPASAPPVSDAIKALAQEHLELAKKAAVTGTPTFYVNGQVVVGADTNKLDQLLKD